MSGWSLDRLRRRTTRLGALLFSTTVPAIAAVLALGLGVVSPFFEITDKLFRFMVMTGIGACLGYLVLERHYIDRLVKTATVTGPFFDSDPVHREAAAALGGARAETHDDRTILIATLPGHSATLDAHFEYGSEQSRGPGLSLLMKELLTKIMAADEWHVRHVINITSSVELEGFRGWLAQAQGAPAYEARAYSTHESLPIIAPLVVGKRETLLGVEDVHKYELKNAIRIEGREIAIWATKYFDDLWDHAPFVVRGRRGADASGLAKLESAILAREAEAKLSKGGLGGA